MDYDYDLPEELIAQIPAEERSRSRLLVLDRQSGALTHGRFEEIAAFFQPGDCLVMNDTRVIPARIEARRATGGKVELFLLQPVEEDAQHESHETSWIVLAKPSSRLKEGEELELARGGCARLRRFGDGGRWEVDFSGVGGARGLFEKGRMPLPHYIKRSWEKDERDSIDRARYQTVYAARDGAVAAPTAGLHFTPSLLDMLRAAGVRTAFVTLAVGVGTFAPVRADDFRSHVMHEEEYEISPATAEAINETRRRGGRIVAVGTTSARVLETVARADRLVEPGRGRTGIYIYPPYAFKAVDALITNFHLPRSTLLLLVSALAGRERILDAYAEAVARGYRFYSYGDAMLIV